MVIQTLNRLKSTGRLKNCEIVILHRGAENNRKIIRGEEVAEVKRSYFLFSEQGKEIFIPNHRVVEIRLDKKAIWKRSHEK